MKMKMSTANNTRPATREPIMIPSMLADVVVLLGADVVVVLLFSSGLIDKELPLVTDVLVVP